MTLSAMDSRRNAQVCNVPDDQRHISCACTLSFTLFFSACEIGQPSFAASAAFWKAAASIPLTVPRTSSVLSWTENPPPPCLGPNVTVAVTSSFCGGLPACARPCDSAIAKQLACAAASSSSGVVFPPASSVRDLHDRPASRSTPLVRELTRPLPDIRSPSQTACARLCMARLLASRGGRNDPPGPHCNERSG